MGYAVREARYRYVEWRDGKTRKVLARELYDHETDPRETVNLAAQPRHEDLVRELTAQIQDSWPRG